MTVSPRKSRRKEPTDAELVAAARAWVMSGMPEPVEWPGQSRPTRDAMDLLGIGLERALENGEPTAPLSLVFTRLLRNASIAMAALQLYLTLHFTIANGDLAPRSVLCTSAFTLLGLFMWWFHKWHKAKVNAPKERAQMWIEFAVAEGPMAAAHWSQLSKERLLELGVDLVTDDDPMREAHRIAQAEQRERHRQERIELARQITLAQDRMEKLEQWVQDWHCGPRAWDEQYRHPFFDDDASQEAAIARSSRRAAARALAELEGPSPRVTPTRSHIRQLLDLVDEAERTTQRAWNTAP